jgi:hypothetical protein
MPIEGGTDLLHALGGELTEALEQTICGKRPDLLAKSLALPGKASLPGWNPNLEGAGRGRPWPCGKRSGSWSRSGSRDWPDHFAARWLGGIEIHKEDVTTLHQSPSTSTLDHSGSSDGLSASAR